MSSTEASAPGPLDPVDLQIHRHLLAAIPEEMGVVLMRSAFSANIKERRDFSCALVGPGGRLLAQASHIPVHLGAVHPCASQILSALDLEPGDVVLVNDPWCGGTHLPDVTLFAPLFVAGEPRLGAMVRAHHADVGGATPGSMGRAEDLFGEGIVIPPLRLVRRGEMQDEILRFFLANTRTPGERRGDLRAQLSAVELGRERLRALVDQQGERFFPAIASLEAHAARATAALIAELPEGIFRAALHLDGPETALLRLAVELRKGRLRLDFSGTDPQEAGPFNANPAITTSAVFYVVRLLLGEDLPTNSGCLHAVDVIIPKGSLLDPQRPAAVAMGNVETSQRIVDLLLAAFAQAWPQRVAACSQGTMNNLSIGCVARDGRSFTSYETLGGGAGAGPLGPGESAIQSHMTNTLNTPIEAMEISAPIRIRKLRCRSDSGGEGKHRGGEGLIKEIEALAALQVTVVASRRAAGAPGASGGGDGAPGRETLVRTSGEEPLPPGGPLRLAPGEALRIETPGGGGFGRSEDW